jgi:3-oxoacyl-[acyl-carrier-protein] synthase II
MKTRERRAVITGVGLVSPLGNDVDAFWRALVAGKSGVTAIPDDLRGGLPVYAAGLVEDFDFAAAVDAAFPRRPRGRLPLFVQYALAAAADAVRSAGFDLRAADPDRLGVVIGNGSGGMPYVGPHFDIWRERGCTKVDPQMLTQIIPNVAVAHIATAAGARGYNATLVASCASGTQAIGEAMRAVRLGLADAVIAGGTEAWVTEIGLISFAVLGALSKWKGDPAQASRPYDKDRSGFVPSQGAAMFVIEELDSAVRRGAPVLAEIRGYGCTNDAYHLIAPDPQGRGAAESIRLALDDAGLAPGDIDYANAHGTGTVRGDIAETRALRLALGDRAEAVPISSTKSMLGHSMGASGALEVVACVQTLKTDIIHPTINLDTPDPLCDLDYVPNEAREARVRAILKSSFGFGGHNASLVLAAPEML